MVMGKENREMDKELIINWSKFRSSARGKQLNMAQSGYIEFCRMLDETGFELVGEYTDSRSKIELVCKYNKEIKINIGFMSFKKQVYPTIIEFKNKIKENGDKFIKFTRINSQNVLVANIKTFDGGEVNISIKVYNKWNKARLDFYNKLKEVNGYTNDFYKDNKEKINVYIDDIEIKEITPDRFKRNIYQTIIKIKEELKENNDEFIKFNGLILDNILKFEFKISGKEIAELNVISYKVWNNSRKDFYNKLEKVGGCTSDYYKGKDVKINIYIDSIKLNLIAPDQFKSNTYKSIINFKDNLIKNKDEFIKFIGLTQSGNLIAKIKTFDKSIIELDIASYNQWSKGRRNTYDYCESKGYKILSPYINGKEKILIDFNCGHQPHWINPSALKYGVGCPICAIRNNSGKDHSRWKGNAALSKHLRVKMKQSQWHKDSFSQTGGKCIISGKKRNLHLHHVYNFNKILLETVESLNLDIREKVDMYSNEELQQLENKCLELHYKYGLGVPLTKELHKEFHNIYGRINNTQEQFEEFIYKHFAMTGNIVA